MAGLRPEDKKALLEALLEEERRVRRLTAEAANDHFQTDSALDAALRGYPRWWLPKYADQAPSRARWRAFAEKRRRCATGMRDLAGLTLLVAMMLPNYVDRWMFIGFSIALALLWAWQFDVANRELGELTALPEWPRCAHTLVQDAATDG
jgi:hypothetical protein